MQVLKVLLVLIIIAIGTGFLFGSSSDKHIIIIVNHKNPIHTIQQKELKNIFYGRKIYWKDGSKIKIADNLIPEIASNFFINFIGTSASNIKKIWIKRMLRGRMSPPESFRSRDELLAFVAKQKNAISFVRSGPLPEGIREIGIK